MLAKQLAPPRVARLGANALAVEDHPRGAAALGNDPQPARLPVLDPAPHTDRDDHRPFQPLCGITRDQVDGVPRRPPGGAERVHRFQEVAKPSPRPRAPDPQLVGAGKEPGQLVPQPALGIRQARNSGEAACRGQFGREAPQIFAFRLRPVDVGPNHVDGGPDRPRVLPGLLPVQASLVPQRGRDRRIADREDLPKDTHPLEGVLGVADHREQPAEPSVDRIVPVPVAAHLERRLQARRLKFVPYYPQPRRNRRDDADVAPARRPHGAGSTRSQQTCDLPGLLRKPPVGDPPPALDRSGGDRQHPGSTLGVRRTGHERLIGHLVKRRGRAVRARKAEIEGASGPECAGERAVEQADHAARRPERHVERQLLAPVSNRERGDMILEVPDVGPRPVDPLLCVSHHAEVAGPRSDPRAPRPRPSRGPRRARNLDKHLKLRRVRVLRLVQDHPPALGANALEHRAVVEQ